ncbi:HD domain-containing protein [Halobacteriovorax sp. XZX-3]|uniref:HD domain-containing protein n=1 Tax=unclassified Halobacteriovorax TaxID=2639665 RepID=UPI0037183F87
MNYYDGNYMRSRVLIISDENILSSVYAANLSAYVGLKVIVAKTKSEIQNYLGRRDYVNLIVCANFLEDFPNISDEILNLISSVKLKSNIIMFNNLTEQNSTVAIPPSVIYIPNRYDIKSIVRSSAKLMNVTAKDMVALDVGDFYPLPLDLLKLTDQAFCDIYLRKEQKDEDEFELVYSKDDKINEKDISAEDDQVYVKSEKRLQCINFLTMQLIMHLKTTATPEEKLKAVEVSLESLASVLLSDEANLEEVSKVSQTCIKIIKEVIEESSELEKLLAYLLANKSSYLYTHSILATYVSQFILKQVSWGNSAQEEKMACAFFFHDIYLAPVYKEHPDAFEVEDLAYKLDVSEQNLNYILMHAKLAAEQVSKLKKLPNGVDQIILQHHGTRNGEGFAMDPGDDISPLSKVMMISESFVNFFFETKDKGQNFSNEQLITFLNQQYTNKSYHKLIAILKDLK